MAILAAGAIGCWLLVLGVGALSIRLSWPHVEAAGHPEFGFNFSCNYAEFLLLEDPALGEAGYVSDSRPGRAEWCADTLATLIEGTGAKHVRLSVEWSEVEPEEGHYDFSVIDAQLRAAEGLAARVLLTVGIKAQRHPEFYIPSWLTSRVTFEPGERVSDNPEVGPRALRMIEAVVAHVADSPAIEAWGADNEPYVESGRAEGWAISPAFVRMEIEAIKSADPLQRPVSINHGQHFVFDRRWQWALKDADVLAASIYPFRNDSLFRRPIVLPILEIGPLGPNYAHQGREARERGKDFWITEMQAEPWAEDDPRLYGPHNPARNLDIDRFERSIGYARKTGASRIYLWGAEWWLYQKVKHGDESWWVTATAAISRSE